MKATQFTTNIGRIVFTGADNGTNSLYDPCTKDFDGNPLGNNDDGTPKLSFRFGLAIAKRPGETGWWDSYEGKIIHAQGFADHPQAAAGSDFSWKVQDGDSTTKTAKAKVRPCDKEGYPGHWVYTFNSGFPLKFTNADGSAYLLDKNAVKCGDYVRVACTVIGNTGKSPGVYLNHGGVSLQGLGAAIMGGMDLKAAFATPANGPAPAGMTPVGNTNTPPPPGGSAPPPPPNSPPPPSTVPQVAVQPAAGFVGAPPPPGGPPPPPPPSGPKMTAKAGGQSYAAFIAGNWTDALLKQHGYIE
jgi:hypothetical protein